MSYTNEKCLKVKLELIESIGGMYETNKEYNTNGQIWYINNNGYVHFIKGDNDILLTNDFTLKY